MSAPIISGSAIGTTVKRWRWTFLDESPLIVRLLDLSREADFFIHRVGIKEESLSIRFELLTGSSIRFP